uniref:Zgc:56585 n=1 Tax=Amphilophus citrinellus TaxID=61819 RepID=A0A3Q0S105_AMPCI
MALNGKTAVVTGAAMGIGKAIVEILLQNGAKVELKLKYGTQSCGFRCDFTILCQAAFQKTIETFGGIDILCNNAGVFNEVTWEKTITINLMGTIKGTYLALEHMNKLTGGRGGVIINVASMAGIGPLSCCPVYTATKHGVIGFTRSFAASVASGYGIRINALCPGFVQTDLFSAIQSKLGQFSAMAGATQELIEKLGVLTTDSCATGRLLQIVCPEHSKLFQLFPGVLPFESTCPPAMTTTPEH